MKLSEKIRKGDRRSLARHLRGLDDQTEAAFQVQEDLRAHVKGVRTIGLTGVPGAGKSTLTDHLIRRFRASGHRVAVLAVDPSSPFTGGAILGDRIRMMANRGDEGVFIRSIATRGALGGLAASVREMVDALDAAGYDVVIVETVGVGQDEIDIVHLAQTNVVLSLPGSGDGVQAIKAGLLEIADIFVVNKCDRPGADQAVRQLEFLLELEGGSRNGWSVPVLRTNGLMGDGLEALHVQIGLHEDFLEESGEGAKRREGFMKAALAECLRNEMNRRIHQIMDQEGVDSALERMRMQSQTPRGAARDLLDTLLRGGHASD